MDILILGAGIAGCSAAISLASAGHKVRVLEKQPAWRFQSSGIFVYSNGLEVLQDLGVLKGILDAGFSIPDGVNRYLDNTGQPIVETRYPGARNGTVPAIVGIKRAELHRVLANRMAELNIPVTLGANAIELTQSESQVAVSMADGQVIQAELLLGADGIHSWVRTQIAPDIQPRYSGFGIWRSVHQRPTDLTQKIMMMGPGKRFGIMPISDDRLYTFGTVLHPEHAFIPTEKWVDSMKLQLMEFAGPAKPFLAELGEQNEVFFTAVEEVVMPLPWHRGRVLLIGDACHASTPFMGQGGAMAMQDALVLVRALSNRDELENALSLFGKARLPVCEFVQDASRAVGAAGAKLDTKLGHDPYANLRITAQYSVDSFYTTLSQLNAKTDLLLNT